MNFFYNLTNLSLAEKSDHFDSILKYCQVSGEAALDNAVSSSTPTDLTIRSQNSEGNSRTIILIPMHFDSGKFVSTNIHCAMLCSQSSYLQSLIQSNNSDTVVILPEVESISNFLILTLYFR